jgi:hypothetical protein
MNKLTGNMLVMILGLFFWLPSAAGASTWTQEFQTDYAGTNAVYLSMNPAAPLVEFEAATFGGGHAGWQLVSNQPLQQFMEGPAEPAGTGGIFSSFSGSQPFSFQWAEVQWQGSTYTLLGSGTGIWNGGWNFTDKTFTHSQDIVHLPLPASALLLGSGLLGLGLLGWRRQSS